MKKLLAIVVLGLMFSGNAYANISLICKSAEYPEAIQEIWILKKSFGKWTNNYTLKLDDDDDLKEIITEGKKDQYGGLNTFEVKDDYIIWTAKRPDGEDVRSIDRLTGEMTIKSVNYKDGKKWGPDKYNCEKYNKKL